MERCKSIVIQLLAEKRQCQKLRSCKQFSWSRQGDAAASAAAAAAAASCSSCCRSTGRRDQSPAAPALKNVQMIILTLVTSLATPFASVTATVHLLLAITERTRGGGFIETTLRVRAGESHSPLRNFSHQIKSKIEFNSTPLTVGDCVLLVTVGPRIRGCVLMMCWMGGSLNVASVCYAHHHLSSLQCGGCCRSEEGGPVMRVPAFAAEQIHVAMVRKVPSQQLPACG